MMIFNTEEIGLKTYEAMQINGRSSKLSKAQQCLAGHTKHIASMDNYIDEKRCQWHETSIMGHNKLIILHQK